MKKSLFALALTLSCWPGPAVAEPVWRFDLTQLFPSPDQEIAARGAVIALADRLERQAGSIADADDLLAAIRTQDELRKTFRKHDLFLFLRFATDTDRADAMSDSDVLRARVRAAERALADAVVARGRDCIAADLAGLPPLQAYGFWLESAADTVAHRPSAQTQAAIDAFAPLTSARDYPATVRAVAVPAEADEQAQLAAYRTQQRLFAHLLADAIGVAEAEARLRGYESAADRAAREGKLGLAAYRALLAEVAAGERYKLGSARSGDPFDTKLRWSADRAVAGIVASARAFDPAYGAEFAALLDPREGRADLGVGMDSAARRLPLYGAGSVYPIGTSTVYMQAYSGTLLDVVVLAHESGHAAQAQLMFKAGVPMAYAAGPGYFTESFARFQELLTLDHLRRNGPPAERGVARDALIARLQAVFPSAEEAAVELAIHDLYRDKRSLDPDLLDKLTQDIGARYSADYAALPARAGRWMRSEGYFMAPMQELNDAYASLLAVRYWVAWRADRRGFRRRYLRLLRGGYDAAPADLLRTNLGIDMAAPDFVSGTLTALNREVARLGR